MTLDTTTTAASAATEQPSAVDPVIWRPDLATKLRRSSETLRRWIKSGKLPEPDVQITIQTQGWYASTLARSGIRL